MSLSKGLIFLTPLEGNIDFNKKDNVIFHPDDVVISKICNSDPKHYGYQNKQF